MFKLISECIIKSTKKNKNPQQHKTQNKKNKTRYFLLHHEQVT